MSREEEKRLLFRILDFFGWEVPQTTGQQRSEETVSFSKLDILILDRKSGRLRHVSRDGHYRSPIYHPDGRRIFALFEGQLVAFDPRGDIYGKKVLADLEFASPAMLLGMAHDKIGFLTQDGHLMVFDLETSKTEPLERNLPDRVQAQAERASRRCINGEILASPLRKRLEGIDGHAADVLVRQDESGAEASNLTEDLETRIHMDPAWSPDCQRVIFVAGSD